MKIGCLAVLVLAGLLLAVALSKSRDAGPAARVPATPSITYAAFGSLSDGMSYADAVRVLGREGTVTSRVSIPSAADTVLYSWQNPDGSNCNATFQNDRLVGKAQAGLR